MRGEQRQFGGLWGLIKSSVMESGLAIVQAPVRMLAHSLFVLVALTGIKLDWKSPRAKPPPCRGRSLPRSWPP